MKILKQIVLFSFTLISLVSFAQEGSKHEVSGWIGGGLSTLNYKTNIGERKNSMGGMVGVGYNYHLNDLWSIGTGVELGLYNSEYKLAGLTNTYATKDDEYDFEFRSKLSRLKEKQNIIMLNIPLSVQYQIDVFGRSKFYISPGVKVGIPVNKGYKISSIDLYNSGFYPVWSGEENLILDTQEFMGFGTYKDYKQNKRTADLNIAFIGTIDTGLSWSLDKSLTLYTGLYFEYSFNDIRKSTDKQMVGYNLDADNGFDINSALNSQYMVNSTYKPVTNKANLMAVGAKIRLSFKL